jgi:hypothetical protein
MPRIETGGKGLNSRWGFNTVPPNGITIAAPSSANVSSSGTQPILIYQLIAAAASQTSNTTTAPDRRILINITGGGFGGGVYQTGASGALPTSPVATGTVFGEVALSVGTPIINAASGSFTMRARTVFANGNLTNNVIEGSTGFTDDVRFNNTAPNTTSSPWFAYRYAMVPAQPGAPSVGFSGNTASVSWNAPDNGEAAINSYTVQYASNSSFSGASAVNTGTSTSTNIGPLSAGTWWFRVYANNVVGDSAISGATSGLSPSPAASWSTAGFTENARVGTVYSKTVTATGIRSANPYAIATGSLPPGISLNTQTGAISGTASAGVSQDFDITVNAFNPDNVATGSSTFRIRRIQPLPTWNDETLSTGNLRVGTAYSDEVVANNAASTNAYSATGLPANGLSLNANTGAITGTPTSTSTFSFTITAANADGATIFKNFTLTPLARLAVWTNQVLTTTTIRVNQVFFGAVAADNAVSYALQTPDTLPPGITLDTGTGVIGGTPTTQGSYSFRIVATNGSNETITTNLLTIVVEPAAGGSVWNGTEWVPNIFKVWNGASWDEVQVKIWNGTDWAEPIS